jgi:HTH-type transcriptional regulator / antitoxin HigA
MRQWNILKTDKDFETAMKRFEEIIDVAKDSPDYEEALLLSFLLNKYDRQKHSFPPINPIKIIKSRMDNLGYTATDLAKAFGDEGTVNKVLNCQQPLSLTMIRKFSKLLRIPADLLVSEYKTAQ